MKNIVSVNWLKENLNKQNLVVVDCRFDLMDKEYGKRSYEKEHIKGAVRVDLEKDLSSEVREHGGRHPLPKIEKLKETFENIGISNESIVVAYDEGDLAGPARLWWILKYLGHKEVYVLNGGIEAFKSVGGEVTSDVEPIEKSEFKVNVNKDMIVDMEYVKDRIDNERVAIVDSRENKRYIGEFEPVDKRAGHIPGALNYFWMDILDKAEDGFTIKSQDKLKELFSKLNDYDEVIVYCGSGVTACPNSLALTEAGVNHKLYAGSYSDWISYEENTVDTI
ncbi:sulfurtransferase [Asaccharospora irregularis]|uniref:Thiosulfate/3-mercaptopyruvate sulfurtransferase n=1 Tax=Asaccharospora irregularis DSM 2635 TaxID=1121321 RepID=A0A1M5QED2_9FIRM|nr:sulfurtransferase [Asaccharospora irregularis]SHH11883.1 thiosulfate/3-mercaptopyruvate sulfurtransferase [Asaccharospora irregularis DSM 2635]